MGRIVFCGVCFYGFLFMVNHTFVVNLSLSAPKGIWLKYPPSMRIRVGDYISFCPSKSAFSEAIVKRGYIPRGRCSYGGMPLLKRVGAVEADNVQVSEDGVFINDDFVKHSRPLVHDSEGRDMPKLRFKQKLRTGELWVESNRDRGLDSRYLGVVYDKSVLNTVVPVWIYG